MYSRVRLRLISAIALALVGVVPSAAPSALPVRADHASSACGEPMDAWHPPVINGCATGHEHGDPPPQWIMDAGYKVSFDGHFNTSPIENTTKHAAMKGFTARLNGVDLYFRLHASSNPLDRSARYHSYEVFARDAAGGVSHWQGWADFGDPVQNRVPRRPNDDRPRPVIEVVDQTAWDLGIGCEQWYGADSVWSWTLSWTICESSTLYLPTENATASDQSTWVPAPDGSLGTRRLLDVSWFADRVDQLNLRGKVFYATQFEELVSGPDDPRCTQTTTKYGVTYQNVCLAQYIAPTMPQIDYQIPGGNEAYKDFSAPGLRLPN